MELTPCNNDSFEFQTTDFVGKDALKEILRQGINKHLVHIEVETDDADPEGNETVWCENKVSNALYFNSTLLNADHLLGNLFWSC